MITAVVWLLAIAWSNDGELNDEPWGRNLVGIACKFTAAILLTIVVNR